MNKNLQKIEFKNFSRNYSGILTNDMDLADKILKENSDANILIVTPKSNTPHEPQAPTWFKIFEKNLDKRLEKIENRLNKLENFVSEQRKFNQYVLDMFKKHKWI